MAAAASNGRFALLIAPGTRTRHGRAQRDRGSGSTPLICAAPMLSGFARAASTVSGSPGQPGADGS